MKVLVLGAGIMGSGIAQLSAMSGHDVVLGDISQDALGSAKNSMETSLGKLEKKGRIDQGSAVDTLRRVEFNRGPDLDGKARNSVDVIIESVPERLRVKKQVIADHISFLRPGGFLGTNTSQLSITSIATAVSERNRSRVIGTHFFNPPVLMRLIELVMGLSTSQSTLEGAESFARSLGRETVVCAKDSPGFLTSRISAILRLECLRMLEEGLASPEDIDKAVRLAFNHPMGPLELGDFNGLDTFLDAVEALQQIHGERFRPTVNLRNLVEAGRFGRKTGQGIYTHEVDE